MPDKILAQPAGTTETANTDSEKGEDGACNTKDSKLFDKFNKLNLKKSEKTEDTTSSYTILDIFRNRHLTINTLCMAFLRLVIARCGYSSYCVNMNLILVFICLT